MANEIPRVVTRHVLGTPSEREPVRHTMPEPVAPEGREVARHVLFNGDFLENDFSGDDFAT